MNARYLLYAALMLHASLHAQISKGYEIATWHQFKPCALSYTFDDNCGGQLPVALPLFDQYGYKTTHFTVSGWIKDWAPLHRAAMNGHEIASHTVSHPHLSELSLQEQEEQVKNAKLSIEENILGSKCETIAYPFCDIGDKSNAPKHHIAGRVCLGTVEQRTPKDFYEISSIPTGTQSAVVTAKDLDSIVLTAKASKGWAVFLIHGIDNDGGYSPTLSADLKAHLQFVHADSAQYWVATFAQVVKYIKERDALHLTEKKLNANTLQLTVADSLDNEVYHVPVTIRRILPKGWQQASVYQGKAAVQTSVVSQGKDRFIVFDVVPDKSVYTIMKNKKPTQK